MSIIPVNRAPSKTHGPDHQSRNSLVDSIYRMLEYKTHHYLKEQKCHESEYYVPGKYFHHTVHFVQDLFSRIDQFLHNLTTVFRKCEYVLSFPLDLFLRI